MKCSATAIVTPNYIIGLYVYRAYVMRHIITQHMPRCAGEAMCIR